MFYPFSLGLIAGVAAGAILVLLIMVALTLWLCRRGSSLSADTDLKKRPLGNPTTNPTYQTELSSRAPVNRQSNVYEELNVQDFLQPNGISYTSLNASKQGALPHLPSGVSVSSAPSSGQPGIYVEVCDHKDNKGHNTKAYTNEKDNKQKKLDKNPESVPNNDSLGGQYVRPYLEILPPVQYENEGKRGYQPGKGSTYDNTVNNKIQSQSFDQATITKETMNSSQPTEGQPYDNAKLIVNQATDNMAGKNTMGITNNAFDASLDDTDLDDHSK